MWAVVALVVVVTAALSFVIGRYLAAGHLADVWDEGFMWGGIAPPGSKESYAGLNPYRAEESVFSGHQRGEVLPLLDRPSSEAEEGEKDEQ